MTSHTARRFLTATALAVALLAASLADARPLRFEPNRGQAAPEVAFVARGAGQTVALTPRSIAVHVGDRVLRLELGARGTPRAEGALPGLAHYLRGRDPAGWVRDVPAFAAVRYPELAPGLALVVAGDAGGLRLGLDLAAGADADALHLRLDGADALAVAPDGGLLATLGGAVLRLPPPTLTAAGRASSARFHLDGGLLRVVAAPVGAPGTPAVRGLGVYVTYLGGTGDDEGLGVAAGPDGTVYVTGQTTSADFPTTDGEPGAGPDVFVTRMAPDGATVIYSVVIGGAEPDIGHSIALDADGSVVVAGETGSPDFPVTPGAFDTVPSAGPDAFVLRLAPDGASVAFSTFVGGDGVDVARGVALDADGSVYVAGFTTSTDFPTTPGVVMPGPSGAFDTFVAKLAPAGDALDYGTYLGGTLDEFAYDLAVRDGEAYVTGETISADLPTTPGVLGPSFSGLIDTFVLHLAPDAASMELTYLGGSDEELGEGIAVAGDGVVYVAGIASTFFPVTPSAAFSDPGGGPEAFLAVLAPDLTSIGYATYYGGTDLDFGCDVALGADGLPVIVGKTNSVDLPVTPDAPQVAFGGITDGFYARFDPAASGPDSFLNGTYMGGRRPDIAHAVAVGPEGLAAVTGFSESLDFPTTPGVFGEAFTGGILDAFVWRQPADFAPVASEGAPVGGVWLSEPSPHPAARRTTLTLTSDRARSVRAELVDALGRVVRTVWDGPVPAGTTELRVSVEGLAPGTYALRLVGGALRAARVVSVVR